MTRAGARAGAAAALALSLLLTACGTRADEAEIIAGAGGGPVSLPPEVLSQLQDAQGGAPAAGQAGTDDAGAGRPGVDAPAATGADVPATVGSGQDPAAGSAQPGAGRDRAPGVGAPPGGRPGGDGAPAGEGAPAGGGPARSADGPSCTGREAPVNIGQVGTYSGVTGAISEPGRTALAVWARDVNARGGLACHPVMVYSQDDGGDSSRAAAAVRDLVATRKVVALVGNSVAFTVAGFRSAVEAAKVPAVGGDLIAPDWHQSPWLFPQGASIDDQVVGFIRQGVAAGKSKLATLYCVEVSACTYTNKLVQDGGAAAAGAELVYSSAISITQTDFTAQCQNAKNAGADQLALGMDGSAMARVARSCLAIGYRPLLSGAGATISAMQARDANLREFNLATATGVAPWVSDDTPGLKAYRAALATYAPGLSTDGASALAWTSAMLLEAAVSKLGPGAAAGPLTAAGIVAGLGKIRGETLDGLTGPLTFSAGQDRAKSSGCVFYELLTPQGWTAPRGSRAICP